MRRGLELIVDQPIEGHFYWTILDREVFGRTRGVLDRAPGPFPTHERAVADGALAMTRHIEPAPLRSTPGYNAVAAAAAASRAATPLRQPYNAAAALG